MFRNEYETSNVWYAVRSCYVLFIYLFICDETSEGGEH